jgi:hypothetical protein
VTYPVEIIKGAIDQFPRLPNWKDCAGGAARGAAEELVVDMAFWALGADDAPRPDDVLIAAGIACFSGGKSSGQPKRFADPHDLRGTNPPWNSLKPYRGDIKTNGLSGKNRRFYVHDRSRHGGDHVEVYNHRCRHIGAMDPVTGFFWSGDYGAEDKTKQPIDCR